MSSLPREVKDTIVRNMVGQGPYAFVSLKTSQPTVLFEDLRPHDWVLVLTALCKVAGFPVPESVVGRLRKHATDQHNQISKEHT